MSTILKELNGSTIFLISKIGLNSPYMFGIVKHGIISFDRKYDSQPIVGLFSDQEKLDKFLMKHPGINIEVLLVPKTTKLYYESDVETIIESEDF